MMSKKYKGGEPSVASQVVKKFGASSARTAPNTMPAGPMPAPPAGKKPKMMKK